MLREKNPRPKKGEILQSSDRTAVVTRLNPYLVARKRHRNRCVYLIENRIGLIRGSTTTPRRSQCTWSIEAPDTIRKTAAEA